MTGRLAKDFLGAIRSVVGDASGIPLHAPEIGAVEKRFVNEALDSTFVSSIGPFVTRFEEEVASFTGAAHAVAVANGTVALEVALVLAGVAPGDEVLVPSLSFVATANAVVHAGAVPHFIDSSADTLGMDPAALRRRLESMRDTPDGLINPETGRRVSAIVPMHTLGHPLDIESIISIAAGFGLPVVEDAAESLGSYVGTRHTGVFGRLGALSFNGNKIVTTGSGGMILTDDPELAREAKHRTSTAKIPHPWEFDHDQVAWNYRMSNLSAALGVAQLTRLETFLEKKRELASRYADAFSTVEGMSFVREPDGTSSNYWLCAVRLDEPSLVVRNELLDAAVADGLQCRPFWKLLNTLRMYRDNPAGDLSTATQLSDSVICLPSSPALVG